MLDLYESHRDRLPEPLREQLVLIVGTIWFVLQLLLGAMVFRIALKAYRRKLLIVQERSVRFRDPIEEEPVPKAVPVIQTSNPQLRRRNVVASATKSLAEPKQTLPSLRKNMGKATLKLWLIEAKGLKKDEGRLDPYVRIRFWYCRDPHGPQKTYEYHERLSFVVEDTCNPKWNDFFYIRLEEGEVLNRVELMIMDWNLLGCESSVGHGWLKLKDKPMDGEERHKWIPLTQAGTKSMLSIKYSLASEPLVTQSDSEVQQPGAPLDFPCSLVGCEGCIWDGEMRLQDDAFVFTCPKMAKGGTFRVPFSLVSSIKSTRHLLKDGVALVLMEDQCGPSVPSDQHGNRCLQFVKLPDAEVTAHTMKRLVRERKKEGFDGLDRTFLDLPHFFQPGAVIETYDPDLLQPSGKSTRQDPDSFLDLTPEQMREITPGAHLYMSPVVLFGRCFSDEASPRFLKTLQKTGCIDPKVSRWRGDPQSPQGAHRELQDTIKFTRKLPLIPLASPRHTQFRYTIRQSGWVHVIQAKVQLPEFPDGKRWHLEVQWILQYTQDAGTDFSCHGGVFVEETCHLAPKIRDAISNSFILAPANCISALVRWGGHPMSREKQSGYKLDGSPLPTLLPERVLDMAEDQVSTNPYHQHPVTPEKPVMLV